MYVREDFLTEIFIVPVRDRAFADNGEVRMSYAARWAAKIGASQCEPITMKAHVRANCRPEGIAAPCVRCIETARNTGRTRELPRCRREQESFGD